MSYIKITHSKNMNEKKQWNYENDSAEDVYRIYLAGIQECYNKMDYITMVKMIRNYHIIDGLLTKQAQS